MSVFARTLAALPPVVADGLRIARDLASPSRRRARALARSSPSELAHAVSPGYAVLAGPFAGLRLPERVSWGGAAARLAGTYEAEVVPFLEACLAAVPDRIIDVGCAEGYYAVGIARRLPESVVLAYDLDPQARREARMTVRLNGVGNVRVRGRINPRTLEHVLRPGTLLIVDCEGYERVLLDPGIAPTLRLATVLVELHEFLDPGLTTAVLDRFVDTHRVELVEARPRMARERAHLSHLDEAVAAQAVDEGRPQDPHPQQWALLTPAPARGVSSG